MNKIVKIVIAVIALAAIVCGGFYAYKKSTTPVVEEPVVETEAEVDTEAEVING